MEEQENQELQNQQEEQGVEKKVVDAGKDMLRQAGKEVAKEGTKKLGQVAAKYVLPYILPALGIIVGIILLASVIFVIKDKIAEIANDVIESISSFIEIGDNGALAPSPKEMIELIDQKLKEIGIAKEDLGMGSENQTDAYLYKYMSASLATELPYVEDSTAEKITDIALNAITINGWSLLEEKDVQGIINIKRCTDGTTKDLKFKKYEDFKKLIEKNDKNVMNYFSIDANWNLCVAKYTKTTTNIEIVEGTTTTSTVSSTKVKEEKASNSNTQEQEESNTENTSQGSTNLENNNTDTEQTIDNTDTLGEYVFHEVKIPYRTATSKYGVPFNFLIILQQISDNPEYVSAVADLIQDGKIEYTIFDTVETIKTVETYTYTQREKWQEENTKEEEKEETTTVTNIMKVPCIALTGKAYPTSSELAEGGWVFEDGMWYKEKEYETQVQQKVKYNVTYKEQKESSKKVTETTTTIVETNSVLGDVTYADVWVMKTGKVYSKNEAPVEYPLGEGSTTKYENEVQPEESKGQWKENQVKTTKVTVQKEELQIVENNTEIEADKFLALWRNTTGYYTQGISYPYVAGRLGITVKYKLPTGLFSYEAPVQNILSAEDMLYELLEKSELTQTHAILMRYLIQYYKDPDTAVEPDLSIFDTTGFTGVGTIEGGSIQEKVWNALINAGFSEYAAAGAMGNIHYESKSFNPYQVEDRYTEYNGGIGICQWTNIDRGTEGRNAQLRSYAASKGKNWQDEDIQVQFLLTELTGEGDAMGYASYQLMTTTNDRYGRIWYTNEWENAQDVETATKAFCYTFERPGTSAAFSSMPTRVELAQKYYNTYAGRAGDYSGDVVRYYQNDYAHVAYGSSTLAKCGCGPTAFSMVATHLTGRTITPEDAISWCGNTYYVWKQGTSWSYFGAATRYFNLGCTVKQTSSFTEVEKALKNGKLVISSQGPGLFTSAGHYILLTKIENGLIYVNDPNKNNAINKGYNNRGFTANEITQSAKQYWIFE